VMAMGRRSLFSVEAEWAWTRGWRIAANGDYVTWEARVVTGMGAEEGCKGILGWG
jgi:hypothetical protein